ncbi:hypothetical protein K1719_046469 [Acacia pycnantha]|nr:hypothetical protein K1719_046469 [Acacia pycnantha]
MEASSLQRQRLNHTSQKKKNELPSLKNAELKKKYCYMNLSGYNFPHLTIGLGCIGDQVGVHSLYALIEFCQLVETYGFEGLDLDLPEGDER